MAYQLYRNTTLGNTLQETLDELIQVRPTFSEITNLHESKTHYLNLLFKFGQITPQLALKVLVHFDRTMNQSLAQKVKNRLTFKVF